MKNSFIIISNFSKIQNRINANDKKPRSFGTSRTLYQAEIHFIEGIGCGEGINASKLSQKLGITNGAVTQIADKLLKKKLIEKYKTESNKKEVYLKLTKEGEIADENHRLFHKELNDKIIEYIDNLSKEQIAGISGLLNVVEKYLPEL